MPKHLLTPDNIADETREPSLRPKSFEGYIGQRKNIERVQVVMESARIREKTLDHLLFYGPPGLGKTTLAGIVAAEMGVKMIVTSGPAIERPGDLAAILNSMKKGDVLFIDEIHRLSRTVEEVLYPAMEDFVIDIVIGKGASAKSIRIDLVPFTLIGATTRAGDLSSPLRDRFGMSLRMELYSHEELSRIIQRTARVLDVGIDTQAREDIASRSRGTPRIVNRLLRRVADYAIVHNDGYISPELAAEALDFLEIDELGLDQTDRRLLHAMIERFDGGPVGLDTLAASTGEERRTIEDVYEPYLLRLGFVQRTPRGRVVLPRAYTHLGIADQRPIEILDLFEDEDA